MAKRSEFYRLYLPKISRFDLFFVDLGLQEHFSGLMSGYPRKTGQLEDSHRDLKCRKARPRWLRIQKPEALMLQSVPPYVDTLMSQAKPCSETERKPVRDFRLR